MSKDTSNADLMPQDVVNVDDLLGKSEIKRDETASVKPAAPLYLQRENCTEEEVGAILSMNYSLAAITPVTQVIYRADNYRSMETKLVYHFLRY
jgi:hypothetical protein